MTSTFSFGFSGEDIDIDDAEINDAYEMGPSAAQEAGASLPGLVEARKHEMEEWTSTLPSQIAYNTLKITSSTATATPLTIARREVFDIRAQLMVEDSAEEQNGELIAGLEKGDIKPNFYEGGFKTWECSIDLAKLLVRSDDQGGIFHKSTREDRHIIELGAGTGVPSLALFAQLLSETTETESTAAENARRTHFTFADYNSAVLRLVTFPNLLLTWNSITSHRNTAPSSEDQTEDKAADAKSREEEEEEEEEEGELDITPELVESFQRDLARRGITIKFISGAWSPAFVDLVFSSGERSEYKTLVLASETIYSPASLVAFSETLLALLRRPLAETKALVAAKKVYFGVGGGVDEFLAVLRTVSDHCLDVKERLDVKSEGVGRIILEI
ncbi:hypothetical protein P175DRAFT_0448198, partial [Aspergillus ochraceoroseus IBT 24754]